MDELEEHKIATWRGKSFVERGTIVPLTDKLRDTVL